MPLDDLTLDEKIDIHLSIRASRLALLDSLCDTYRVGRGAVVEALLDEYKDHDLSTRVPSPQAGRSRAKPGGGKPRRVRS